MTLWRTATKAGLGMRPDETETANDHAIYEQRARVGRSVKCPPFDPIFPPFQPRSPRHAHMARSADRAVPVRLMRFLAVIRVPFGELWEQEQEIDFRTAWVL